MNVFLTLLWEFFKTGLFAVGGGLATIPFLNSISQRYGWFSIEDLSTMIAVSESTPGPMGVNMSTYVGNHMFGFWGGVATTLALVTPSIIVVCLIAKALDQFQNSKVVKGIFNGLHPAVVGFILSAVLGIFLSTLLNIPLFQQTNQLSDLFAWRSILIFGALLGVYKWKDLHPIIVILLAAGIGMLFQL